MGPWSPTWHAQLDQELAHLATLPLDEQAAIRRALSADPVAFAVIYLDRHLASPEADGISFSEVHYEWAARALSWIARRTGPMECRHADIAPRSTGKSTWWFLILPLWAAAHGHVQFAAAFAHSATQAEGHLTTFKRELDTNVLLRNDFPELCTPARRQTGSTVADRQSMLHSLNGFTFAARGIDSATLGMKVGERRPDLLILDDVEPDEASYSALLAEKRLGTILDAILPLNIYAKVQFVGTVTMPGSVMHQLVKAAQDVEVAGWIRDEQVVPHHHRAIATADDGTERSIWPEKWPLDWLQSRRHTREYAKNYDNDPMAREGQYWVKDDFRYSDPEGATRTLLAIDPTVTDRKTSDYVGIAIVSFRPPRRHSPQELAAMGSLDRRRAKEDRGTCWVRHAVGVRMTGGRLRDHVARLLGEYPDIRAVLLETNAGGDLWEGVFGKLPGVKVITHWSGESKEVRFARALEHYQRLRVFHQRRLDALEEQAVAFPRGGYDDVLDAACAGIAYFLDPERKGKSYITMNQWA